MMRLVYHLRFVFFPRFFIILSIAHVQVAALVGCAVELEAVYMPLLQNVLSLSSFQMNNQMLCLEEALKLWWVAVSHAPFLSPDVGQSFPALDVILERNVDYITVYKRGMRILQGMIRRNVCRFVLFVCLFL
jgi:hypothetical protein